MSIAVVTSLSPAHTNRESQHDAIESWKHIGDCYSMNCYKEIVELKDKFPEITFIETGRTAEKLLSKPLVHINAMMDLAQSRAQDVVLVNSDIVIPQLPPLRKDGITIFSRYDYTDELVPDETTLFTAGFDTFFIPKEFFYIFPESIYCMGAAWWDYFLPYVAIQNNIPVYYPEGRFAFHKLHPVQYSFQEWVFVGEYFRNEFNIGKRLNAGQVATKTLALIKSKLIT